MENFIGAREQDGDPDGALEQEARARNVSRTGSGVDAAW